MKFGRRKPAPQERRRATTNSSMRPAAFSYHANRTEQDINLGRLQPRDQDTRHKERIVRYWRQRLGMLAALIVLILCVISILQLSGRPKIVALSSSSVSSSFLQPLATYQAAASKLFAGSLANGNKLTINSQAIEAKLKAQFPELSSVSIVIPLMSHQAIIYGSPTTPSMILSGGGNQFVLDNTGKALLAASSVPGLSQQQLPVVQDQSDTAPQIGQTALPSSLVSFIETVSQELRLKGVAVASYTLPTTAYELDIQPKGAGYLVKFNLHDNTALEQVGAFLAVQQRLSSQHITPSSYIDVRLVGRAYYK